jgi:hypothetical protein
LNRGSRFCSPGGASLEVIENAHKLCQRTELSRSRWCPPLPSKYRRIPSSVGQSLGQPPDALSMAWKPLKGTDDKANDRARYRCACGSWLVFVVREPVARKVHVQASSRRRIVAECAVCGRVTRVALGGPS